MSMVIATIILIWLGLSALLVLGLCRAASRPIPKAKSLPSRVLRENASGDQRKPEAGRTSHSGQDLKSKNFRAAA
jgi:hypothetical protein